MTCASLLLVLLASSPASAQAEAALGLLSGPGSPRELAARYQASGLPAPAPLEAAELAEAGVSTEVLAAVLDPEGDGWPRVRRLEGGLELGFPSYRILAWPARDAGQLVVTGYDASGERLAPPVEPLPASLASEAPVPATAIVTIIPDLIAPSEPAHSTWMAEPAFLSYTAYAYPVWPAQPTWDPHASPPAAPPPVAPAPAPTLPSFIGHVPILFPAGQANAP